MRASVWLLSMCGCLEGLDVGGKPTTTADTGSTYTSETTNPTLPDDDLDCDADYPTPAPGGSFAECLTEEVSCGDVVYGTLEGGSTLYDYDYWLMLGALDSLMGEPDALDGAERVYAFRDSNVEQSIRVTVRSCFDHWVDWISRGDFCSVDSFDSGGVFEGGVGRLWYTERLDPQGQYDYEFIIEGLYGATGNYVLTVECF